MNPRVEYEMTQEDLNEILEACKPVPCIMVGSYIPSSPQENANRAWEQLGKKMGFDYLTVRPSNRGQRFFTAVPSETEPQRMARIELEMANVRRKEIAHLEEEIKIRQEKLKPLIEAENQTLLNRLPQLASKDCEVTQ